MSSTATNENSRPASSASPQPGRSLGAEWLLVVLVLAIGVFLIVEGTRLRLPLNVGYLGPQWFPIGVGALLLPLACALAVQALRQRGTEVGGTAAPGSSAAKPDTDWHAFALVVATLAAHVLLLVLLGWIPAGTVLFWGVARALGSTRALFDLGVAVVFSCTVQFAFSAGLGIALPVGLLLEVL